MPRHSFSRVLVRYNQQPIFFVTVEVTVWVSGLFCTISHIQTSELNFRVSVSKVLYLYFDLVEYVYPRVTSIALIMSTLGAFRRPLEAHPQHPDSVCFPTILLPHPFLPNLHILRLLVKSSRMQATSCHMFCLSITPRLHCPCLFHFM